MTPEGKIKAKVNAVIKVFGTAIWRFMPVQTGYGSPALDYILCVNGTFVSIETKADRTKKLTPLQEGTRVFIEAAGGLVFVVYDMRTLWIATRCLMQLIYGNTHAIELVRRWYADAPYLQTQDEGTCSELVRKFLAGETPHAPTGGPVGTP